MSEAEVWHYCKKCKDDTLHMFSGSLRKGVCLTCDNELSEDEHADIQRVVSYSG